MPYTQDSRAKWLATMVAKFGSEQAVKDEMARRKQKQGMESTTGGFASDKVGRDGLTGKERAKLYGGRNVTKVKERSAEDIEEADTN